MFPSADYYRLDWRPEFNKLAPYLNGQGGVVRIDIASEETAADKFNHILKEDFGCPGNGSWLSLRIDHDWSTTYTVDDQIQAFAAKLSDADVEVQWPDPGSPGSSFFSNNAATGDLSLSMENSTINSGIDASPYGVHARVLAICDAVRQFAQNGGHFMIVLNDMAKDAQGRFWKHFWQAGLQEAGGDNLVLVYYVGPHCEHDPHADAPTPDVRFRLPTAIEGDDAREADVYDDFLDLFEKAGHSREEAAMAFDTLISGHGHSVRALQIGLAALALRLRTRNSGGAS